MRPRRAPSSQNQTAKLAAISAYVDDREAAGRNVVEERQHLRRGDSGSEAFADAFRDGCHLELRARHVAQQLVRGRALAERPQLAQQVAGVALREPVVPELAAQEVAQLRLERPRAEVAGDVEAAVDVVEVALRVDRQLQRVAEDLGVAGCASS